MAELGNVVEFTVIYSFLDNNIKVYVMYPQNYVYEKRVWKSNNKW